MVVFVSDKKQITNKTVHNSKVAENHSENIRKYKGILETEEKRVLSEFCLTLFVRLLIWKYMKENICSICGEKYGGLGNNAQPINNGRCCNICNDVKVTPARISLHFSKLGKKSWKVRKEKIILDTNIKVETYKKKDSIKIRPFSKTL